MDRNKNRGSETMPTTSIPQKIIPPRKTNDKQDAKNIP